VAFIPSAKEDSIISFGLFFYHVTELRLCMEKQWNNGKQWQKALQGKNVKLFFRLGMDHVSIRALHVSIRALHVSVDDEEEMIWKVENVV
jgi:hypothetical protein